MGVGRGRYGRVRALLFEVAMIYLYSGNPGSGKSLHAVSDMLRYDKKAWPIVSNFGLNRAVVRNPDRLVVTPNDVLTPDFLERYAVSYWKAEGVRISEERILLVIDEAQLVFNARSWRQNSDWISFFTQHRKMGYCCILIAQAREMLDKQIRAVIEYEYKHRKLANAGFGGAILSFLLGSRFLYKREWAGIRVAGKGASLGWKMGHYGRRTFKAYDTFKTW